MKELNIIQTKLIAPKGQRNTFGKYNYRSLEDICEAVRPLLAETKCTLTFTDDLVYLEGRFYIKSTATLTNPEGESASAVGYAREQENKAGCDQAQVTGGASSYARKYAASSLLCVSGADDIDSMDNTNEGTSQPAKKEPKPKAKPAATADKPAEKKTITKEMVDSNDPIVAQLVAWVAKSGSSDEVRAKCTDVIRNKFVIADDVLAELFKKADSIKQQ